MLIEPKTLIKFLITNKISESICRPPDSTDDKFTIFIEFNNETDDTFLYNLF